MNVLRPVARFVSWHRRAVAAVLAALCAAAIAMAAAPPPPATAPVLVVARSLGAGATLTQRDVEVRHLPRDYIPDGALTTADGVDGRTLSVELAEGTPLQAGMLASGNHVAPGRSLVPIVVSEPQLRELLAPGTLLTLVHADAEFTSVLTPDARVAALPAELEHSGLQAGGGDSAVVLVDVPSKVAPQVSVLGQAGQLSVILGGT